MDLEGHDATLIHLALLELGHSIDPNSESNKGRDSALAHLRGCSNCQASLVRLIDIFVRVREALKNESTTPDGPRCH